MAIYHFSAKVISRGSGSSAVASAAYRSAERLHDQHHDFTNKAGVVHSEVLLPKGAPERLCGNLSPLILHAGVAIRVSKLAILSRCSASFANTRIVIIRD